MVPWIRGDRDFYIIHLSELPMSTKKAQLKTEL